MLNVSHLYHHIVICLILLSPFFSLTFFSANTKFIFSWPNFPCLRVARQRETCTTWAKSLERTCADVEPGRTQPDTNDHVHIRSNMFVSFCSNSSHHPPSSILCVSSFCPSFSLGLSVQGVNICCRECDETHPIDSGETKVVLLLFLMSSLSLPTNVHFTRTGIQTYTIHA